jgi:hypothetical protein
MKFFASFVHKRRPSFLEKRSKKSPDFGLALNGGPAALGRSRGEAVIAMPACLA